MDPSAPWRVVETPQTTAEAAGPSSEHPKLGGSRVLLAAAGAVVAVSVAAALLVASRPSGDIRVISDPSASVAPAASQAMLVVEVAGAVVRPGVYALAPGSRVSDAIRAAGGYSPDVDPRQAETQLNLAARVQDAQLIRVPRHGDSGDGSSAGATGRAPAGSGGSGAQLNLNTASAAQLDTLPGIGPVTAEKIVTAREQQPFAKVDDLVTRKILSAAALAKIRALVSAG